MVLLDEMSAVFAEASRKGSSPINMALLPVTRKGEDGYEVERVEEVAGFGGNPGGNVLHLRIRGKKVRVWSRTCIDELLNRGLNMEWAHKKGKLVKLVLFNKAPLPRGKYAIEATLRLIKNPQAVIQPEPMALVGLPPVAVAVPSELWPRSSKPAAKVKAVPVEDAPPPVPTWPADAKFRQDQTVWFASADTASVWSARVGGVERLVGGSLVYCGQPSGGGWVRFEEKAAYSSAHDALNEAVNVEGEGEWSDAAFEPGQVVFSEDGIWQITGDYPEEHEEDAYGQWSLRYLVKDLLAEEGGTVRMDESELHALPPENLLDCLRELQGPSEPEPEPEPEPATPVLPELEDDDPIIRPPRRGDGKAVHFWRGAEFNHGSELLLARAISRFSESMPAYSGLVAIPNGVVLLKGCRKTHRKLDFLVVLNENGGSVTACVEVDGSSHDGRYLGDEARQDEFTSNGFHHIKRFSAEKVMADADAVVQELVAWMRSLRGTGTTGAAEF